MIIVISGPSGGGKNTVINHLINIFPDKYDLLPTLTTRERRPNESEGHPYFFVSEQEFSRRLNAGEFYEHQMVHDRYYGTSKLILNEKLLTGKLLLKDIDVFGTMNLVRVLENEDRLVTFFFRVEDKNILIQRLMERGEKEIELRLERFDIENSFAKKYNYIIDNLELDKTVRIVNDIIDFENAKKLLFSTDSIRYIQEAKVREYAKMMAENICFDPIEVAVKNGNVYIIDGHHRYLASIHAQKNIAKLVMEPEYIDDVEQFSWEDLIEFIRRL